MNNFSCLTFKRSKRSSAMYLLGLLLLFTPPVKAIDLQCELAENIQINPAIMATMLEAANKGYLYRVETSTSNVTFEVNHFPFSTVEGQFNKFEGGLVLPEGRVQLKQALFIIKVDSVATGDDELNDYIKSDVFFNAMQFPVILFVSTGFEIINESTARLIGELTLHGMTRPLVFNVHMNTAKNYNSDISQRITMIASAEIQRSDFGMHGLQVFVSDTVRFNLKIDVSRVSS